MNCCQCSRRIPVGSMCEECRKRNQQGDGWRLKARHYHSRLGKNWLAKFIHKYRKGHKLSLAIKAAKIRMPWQRSRGFEWAGPSPLEPLVGVVAHQVALDQYFASFPTRQAK